MNPADYIVRQFNLRGCTVLKIVKHHKINVRLDVAELRDHVQEEAMQQLHS